MRPETISKCMLVPELMLLDRTLKSACAEVGVSLTTFHEVRSSVKELAVSYARVKEMQCDIMADELIEIADNKDLDPQHARNRLDTRKWLMAKLAPKSYGDRIDLNVSQSLSIADAQREARARVLTVLPDCYQELGSNIQGTLASSICEASPTDHTSDDEDIFS